MKIVLRPITVGALAVTAALGLSACGSLDEKGVEKTIVSDAKKSDLPLRDMKCEPIKAEVGAPIRCTATGEGIERKIVAIGKVTSDEGDEFEYEYDLGFEEKGTVIAARARATIEVEAGKLAEDLTCPKTVLVPTQAPVRCVVTVDGGKRFGVGVEIDASEEVTAKIDDEPLT